MAHLTADQRDRIIQIHLYMRAVSKAARLQVASWALDQKMSDAEARDLTTYLNMNVDRFQILAQQVVEGIRAESIPALYLNCLVGDWEFSWHYAPDSAYWPKGLNYGLDAVRKKFRDRG